jgi:hypothetical protein
LVSYGMHIQISSGNVAVEQLAAFHVVEVRVMAR